MSSLVRARDEHFVSDLLKDMHQRDSNIHSTVFWSHCHSCHVSMPLIKIITYISKQVNARGINLEQIMGRKQACVNSSALNRLKEDLQFLLRVFL